MHLKHILALICALASTSQAQDCGICQASNEVHCITQTEYSICVNNKAIEGKTFTCPPDTVCSNVDKICVTQAEIQANSNIKDICATGGSECSSCPTTGKLACVSRTQYARCVDGQVSSDIFLSCPANEICVQKSLADNGEICVPECVATYYKYAATCANTDYEPEIPQTPPVAPNLDALKEACNAAPENSDPFFYVKNPDDPECRSYVYCEPMGSNMLALYMTCANNKFFNLTTRKCQDTRPTGCEASNGNNGGTEGGNNGGTEGGNNGGTEGGNNGGTEGGNSGGTEGGNNGGTEGGNNGGTEGGNNGGSEGGNNGGTEGGNNGGTEGGNNGGTEGGNNGGTEGGNNGGSEGGNNGGTEGGNNGGTEGGNNGGTESGSNGGTEGGNNAGTEGGNSGTNGG